MLSFLGPALDMTKTPYEKIRVFFKHKIAELVEDTKSEYLLPKGFILHDITMLVAGPLVIYVVIFRNKSLSLKEHMEELNAVSQQQNGKMLDMGGFETVMGNTNLFGICASEQLVMYHLYQFSIAIPSDLKTFTVVQEASVRSKSTVAFETRILTNIVQELIPDYIKEFMEQINTKLDFIVPIPFGYLYYPESPLTFERSDDGEDSSY